MIPQDVGYYHAGYIVATSIYVLYTLSLWWRWRKLRQRSGGERG